MAVETDVVTHSLLRLRQCGLDDLGRHLALYILIAPLLLLEVYSDLLLECTRV